MYFAATLYVAEVTHGFYCWTPDFLDEPDEHFFVEYGAFSPLQSLRPARHAVPPTHS